MEAAASAAASADDRVRTLQKEVDAQRELFDLSPGTMASKCINVWLHVAASGTTDSNAIMACSRMHRRQTSTWLRLSAARHRALSAFMEHWKECAGLDYPGPPGLVSSDSTPVDSDSVSDGGDSYFDSVF